MATETEAAAGPLDTLKWAGAISFAVVGLTGFYYFSEISLLLRVIGILAIGAGAIYLASLTASGKIALGFVRDARTEVRKVVWPTQKETIQTTLIVMASVSVVALFLWGVDAILAVTMRALLGHGA